MTMTGEAFEVNFDGLVGPTHNYAGLSYGNIAATKNALTLADPRAAALEGLAKMRRLMALGLLQGVLPPHERPHVPTLRRLGFTGSDRAVLETAMREAPALVRNVASASAMWTANAATVTPSADSADGRVHFTPANLVAMFHRSIEPPVTGRILKAIFPEGRHFAHHEPLPAAPHFGDEGAANHNRLAGRHGMPGLHLFVYGKPAFSNGGPERYPARQTREASEAIARRHGVSEALFWPQNPKAIDAGSFHNDVVSVANLSVFFLHEEAFAEPEALIAAIRAHPAAPEGFTPLIVPTAQVSLADAVHSYLFNSQLLEIPGREGMTLVLPLEVKETPSTARYVETLLAAGGPIRHAEYLDVRQSMRNGGGPACLRLRVVLDETERAALGGRVLLDEAQIARLESWVRTHYRDRMTPHDLGDPELLDETRRALDELTQILAIGSVYDFQRS
ncbi:MAG: N-succinylarginine dihydrolase [Rhodothalassiaceae bacterium]